MVLRELEDEGFLRAGGYGLGASLTRDEHGPLTSPLGAKFLDFCSGIEGAVPPYLDSSAVPHGYFEDNEFGHITMLGFR